MSAEWFPAGLRSSRVRKQAWHRRCLGNDAHWTGPTDRIHQATIHLREPLEAASWCSNWHGNSPSAWLLYWRPQSQTPGVSRRFAWPKPVFPDSYGNSNCANTSLQSGIRRRYPCRETGDRGLLPANWEAEFPASGPANSKASWRPRSQRVSDSVGGAIETWREEQILAAGKRFGTRLASREAVWSR